MTEFRSDYDRLLSIWPAFLALGDELAETRNRYFQMSRAARGAGDTAAASGFDAGAARLADMIELHRATLGQVNGWRDTWESIKEAMAQGGEWYGAMPGMAGLAAPGVVVGVSAVAGIAALAVVLSRYLTLRNQLDREAQIMAKIDAGQLSPAEGAELIKAGAPGGLLTGLFSGIGGSPLSIAILLAGGLLVFTQIRGLR